MEQKTEASQAVDEQWIFDLAAEYEFPGAGLWGNVTFSSTGLVEFARAALKAQPAPTEAAQGDGPFKFVPWSKESEMIEGWKKAEKARNEAEGEDRYRLADGYLTGTVVSDPNASWIAIRYESMEQAAAAADLLFSMIDRARASAETGGVKS